jgi:cell wall-associated NlpC family hydrolase
MTAVWSVALPVPARVAEIRARFAPPPPIVTGDAAAFGAALTGATSELQNPGLAPVPDVRINAGFAGMGATSVAVPSMSSFLGPATGDDVVPLALRLVGVPYVWGGNDPATGLDCSGFTRLVYGELGVSLPRVSTDQARTGAPVSSLAEAKPGDLLAFGSPVDHVAIYLGDGRMVHAAGTGKGVRVDEVYRAPTTIRRLLPGGPS